ncbi:MAG TPA: flagellar hook-basal body complex protein [Planctomycetes bacterium]|nr:flagellar hook-basal body complex protein [Planctomycetota bacterium]
MTKKRKISDIILCVVLLVFVAAWIVGCNNTDISPPVPAGHHIEKDTSRIKLLNAQRSIVQAKKVVVENLTNTHTIGYKRNLVRFMDSTTVVVSRDMSQGELIRTNRNLDVAILGRGYIAVTDARGEILYTRCGTLMLNAEGELIQPNGYALEPVIQVPSDSVQIHIGDDGAVNCTTSEGTCSMIGNIQLAVFDNAEALLSKGKSLHKETAASGIPVKGTPGSEGLGEIKAGFIESSNVNESEELRILEDLEIYESHVQKAIVLLRPHL